ncbi:MAG: SGNH/GDSL hydrolase family protein [Eubacteriales bacterium]|nr:SGNH/GDSL hydrolase family protein [Eubacteriales bacterium]
MNEKNQNNQSANVSLTGLKNLMWSLGIVVCLLAVAVGLLFATFHRNYGEKVSFNPEMESKNENSGIVLGEGSGNSRGILNTLLETEDAGQEYIDSLTFLVDSSFIALRDMQLVGTNQVWATMSGSMSMEKVHTANIKFPNDGSEISAASAAMVSQPDILVIGIGMDGLSKVDETTFLINYETLINSIMKASPNTRIICCGLPSVIPGYTGSDGLGVSMVSDGNDWVQLVCRDTGAYYLEIGEVMCESVQLLSRFAASNGKTLNRQGIEEFLAYARTHALQ